MSNLVELMAKYWHKLMHLLHWNTGTCHSFYEGDRLIMSFKCGQCGKLDGIHDITKMIDDEISKECIARTEGDV